MTTLSNVINDLHFCFEMYGSGHRCPNCTHRGMKDTDPISCDEILIRDAIGYLQDYRDIIEHASPNGHDWIIDILKKAKNTT